MPARDPHEMTVDQLFAHAWHLDARQHGRGGPRFRRSMRAAGKEVRDELERRGFDVALWTALEEHIAEVDGHADVWRVFLNAELFQRTVEAMVRPFRHARITMVVGIEARGFILGSPAALHLNAGFAAVRKGGHLPGPKLQETMSRPDYREARHELSLQASALDRRDRVLLVDDWIERGSQASAARALVEQARATFVGASVIVNQLPAGRLQDYGSLHYLVRYFPSDDK